MSVIPRNLHEARADGLEFAARVLLWALQNIEGDRRRRPYRQFKRAWFKIKKEAAAERTASLAAEEVPHAPK